MEAAETESCETWLGKKSLEEQVLIALILSNENLNKIEINVDALVGDCIFFLSKKRDQNKLKILEDTYRLMRLNVPIISDFDWVKKRFSKRFEAFLERRLDFHPAEIQELSKKQQFIIYYTSLKITDKRISSIDRLQVEWQLLENTNEFRNLTIKDEEDFVKYFSEGYKKWLSEHHPLNISNKILLKNIYSIEDALIWLDDYSFYAKRKNNSDPRGLFFLLVRKIHKSWKQKYDRAYSRKIQKNFSIRLATNRNLEKLANQYRVSQAKIISILIEEEYKKTTHLKHLE